MCDSLAFLHYMDQGCRLEDQQGWLRTPLGALAGQQERPVGSGHLASVPSSVPL